VAQLPGLPPQSQKTSKKTVLAGFFAKEFYPFVRDFQCRKRQRKTIGFTTNGAMTVLVPLFNRTQYERSEFRFSGLYKIIEGYPTQFFL
jgi:hypothetical protein